MSQSSLAANLDARVTGLLERLGVSGPPTDLGKLAQARQIRRVVLQNMIPRGGLATVHDGFEVFLRHVETRELPLGHGDALATLNRRQRFTLAHELAHTFFFRLDQQPPAMLESVPSYLELEDICDRTAAQILVPTGSLRRLTRNREAMSSGLVVEVANAFSVSIDVALRRLSSLTDFDSAPVGVLLAARRGAPEHRISAMFFKAGLLPFVPKPKANQSVSEWCRLVGAEVPSVQGKVIVNLRSGAVELRSVGLGDESFLLEISGMHSE